MVDLSFSIADLEYFLLIFVRVTSFIYIAPFFSMSNTPNRVKVGLGLLIAYFIDRNIPHVVVEYETLFGFAAIVIKEAACGFLIGLGANLCTTIVSFSGHITDMETGLSMASLFDPLTKEQTSISGIYYNYIIMLMLLVSGMHQFILGALIETFTIIPINTAEFRMNEIADTMLQFLRNYIIIGFRIALPVFIVTILVNAILGILAKVSPQMNMFAVGIQIKILIGIGVLLVTAGMLPLAADMIFGEMKRMVTAFAYVLG
ncbi:MAG: flagellar biosynthetic protein FliR [Lachnospiraceae bacterium]|jgi:flagellar biosynthetic protein FliR|nr:flagellar biosynthetic protein FliR [Lachnospiraceae bacterium]